MGDLTKNFSRSEFECKCGCKTFNLDHLLLFGLQDLRDFFGHEIFILSGCRCVPHNEKVHGAKHSYHIATASKVCMAADIKIPGLTARNMMHAVYGHDNGTVFHGLGIYPDPADNFIHLDTRRAPVSRWKRIKGIYTTVQSF